MNRLEKVYNLSLGLYNDHLVDFLGDKISFGCEYHCLLQLYKINSIAHQLLQINFYMSRFSELFRPRCVRKSNFS